MSENAVSDIRGLISLLAAHWKAVLLSVLVGSLLGYGLGWFLPKQYESNATVYVRSKSPAAGGLSALVGAQATQSGYLASVLVSRPMRKLVVSGLKADEISALGLDRPDRPLPVSITRDDTVGTVRILSRCKDPVLAARVVNLMLRNLGGAYEGRSQRNVRFIAKRMKQIKKAMDEAAAELEKFQHEHQVWSVQQDAEAALEQLRALQARRVEIETTLKGIDSQLVGEVDPDELVSLKVRRSAAISSRDYVDSQIGEMNGRVAKYPDLARQYAALELRIRMLQKTFEVLGEQYQMAALPQVGVDGDYEIIERAEPALDAVFPRKKTTTLLGALVAFVIAAEVILIRRSRALVAH